MQTARKILVVDDDEQVQRLLGIYLRRDGYEVREVGSVSAMWRLWDNYGPNLILLDLTLPDGDGLDIAREIRKHSNVPIIMLTGKGSTIDRVVGLEMGADDYVTKPFDERELLARIHTVLRRSPLADATVRADSTDSNKSSRVVFDDWILDRLAIELTSPDGEAVPVTSYEFRLLELFATHPHRTLTRDQILEHLAERDWTPYDRSIDVMIGKLRKKIEKDPKNPRYIKTIRGIGYKFTPNTSA